MGSLVAEEVTVVAFRHPQLSPEQASKINAFAARHEGKKYNYLGVILQAPRGGEGFGYDPIFFDPALNAGAAELPPEIKNRVSHRGQALAQLRTRLRDARFPP